MHFAFCALILAVNLHKGGDTCQVRVFAPDFSQLSTFPWFGDTAPCLYQLKIPSSIYLKVLQILCGIYSVSLSVAQNEIDAKISKLSRIVSKVFFFFRVTKSCTLSNRYLGHLQHQNEMELRIIMLRRTK